MPRKEHWRAYSSKYPINEGTIFRLDSLHGRENLKFGHGKGQIPHVAYLWILKVYKGKLDQLPKERNVKVVRIWSPDIDGSRHLIVGPITRKISFQNLCKVLKANGFTVVSKKAGYNYTTWSVKNAYRQMGILP